MGSFVKLLKEPQAIETRVFPRVCYALINKRKHAIENVFCAIAEFKTLIFELKCTILNFDNS